MPDLRGAVQQGLIRQVHGALVIRQKRRPGERRCPMETIYMALVRPARANPRGHIPAGAGRLRTPRQVARA